MTRRRVKSDGAPLAGLEGLEVLQGRWRIREQERPALGILGHLNGPIVDPIIDPVRRHVERDRHLRHAEKAREMTWVGLTPRVEHAMASSDDLHGTGQYVRGHR